MGGKAAGDPGQVGRATKVRVTILMIGLVVAGYVYFLADATEDQRSVAFFYIWAINVRMAIRGFRTERRQKAAALDAPTDDS